MPDVSAEYKGFRVLRWLERLEGCARKLSDVRAELWELDADCSGIKAVRYDKAITAHEAARADLIGDLVAEREERRDALTAEADSLEQTARCGERILFEAWAANQGAADASFMYVIERYARGTEPTEAAATVGLGRYAAKLAARRVAPMIYDHAPEVFGGDTDSPQGYYGYREAMGRTP